VNLLAEMFGRVSSQLIHQSDKLIAVVPEQNVHKAKSSEFRIAWRSTLSPMGGPQAVISSKLTMVIKRAIVVQDGHRGYRQVVQAEGSGDPRERRGVKSDRIPRHFSRFD
jgi:hypothetical protein